MKCEQCNERNGLKERHTVITAHKIFLKIVHVSLSGLIAIIICSIFCFAYEYNMLRLAAPSGATDHIEVPNSLVSNMHEGFAWNIMDDNGYNNVKVPDSIDILIMGGSQIEALQIPSKESVTYLLDQRLENYSVYNIGQSGHDIYICVNYLENACKYFTPSKYVVIDTKNVLLDEESMQQILCGEHVKPYLQSDNKILSFIRDYLPATASMVLQLQEWYGRSHTYEEAHIKDKNLDDKYECAVNDFLTYASDIARKYGVRLIILYHPFDYSLDEKGNMIFADDSKELSVFQKVCDKQGIMLVNSKNEFMDMYDKWKVLPNGFANTLPGTAHFNKYGHKALANVLENAIEIADYS